MNLESLYRTNVRVLLVVTAILGVLSVVNGIPTVQSCGIFFMAGMLFVLQLKFSAKALQGYFSNSEDEKPRPLMALQSFIFGFLSLILLGAQFPGEILWIGLGVIVFMPSTVVHAFCYPKNNV